LIGQWLSAAKLRQRPRFWPETLDKASTAEAVNAPISATKATRLIALPGHPCKRLPFSPTFMINRKSNSRK
jgi:hypothetical protein